MFNVSELRENPQKLKSYGHFKNMDGLNNQRSQISNILDFIVIQIAQWVYQFHKILRQSLPGGVHARKKIHRKPRRCGLLKREKLNFEIFIA